MSSPGENGDVPGRYVAVYHRVVTKTLQLSHDLSSPCFTSVESSSLLTHQVLAAIVFFICTLSSRMNNTWNRLNMAKLQHPVPKVKLQVSFWPLLRNRRSQLPLKIFTVLIPFFYMFLMFSVERSGKDCNHDKPSSGWRYTTPLKHINSSIGLNKYLPTQKFIIQSCSRHHQAVTYPTMVPCHTSPWQPRPSPSQPGVRSLGGRGRGLFRSLWMILANFEVWSTLKVSSHY